MYRLKLFAILLWVSLASACSTASYVRNGKVVHNSDQSVTGITQAGNLIFVTVHIGAQPHVFLYDTGAAITIIDSNKIRDYIPLGSLRVNDAHGVQNSLPRVQIPEVTINETHFYNTEAVLTNLDWFPSFDTLDGISGILGTPVISKANWVIDLNSNTITLSKSDLAGYHSSEKLSFDKKRQPYISVSAKGATDEVEFDTGSTRGLTISENSDFGKALAGEHGEIHIERRGSINDISADTSILITDLPLLLGENISLTGVPIQVTRRGKNKIGGAAITRLQHFGLDFKRQRLVLY